MLFPKGIDANWDTHSFVRNLDSIAKSVYYDDKCEDLKISNIVSEKLATVVEGDQKAPFSIATTPRCRLWLSFLYPWYVPNIAEC